MYDKKFAGVIEGGTANMASIVPSPCGTFDAFFAFRERLESRKRLITPSGRFVVPNVMKVLVCPC